MTSRNVLIYMMVGGCLLQAGRGLYRLTLEAASVHALGRATQKSLQDVVSTATNRPPAPVRVVLSRRDTAIIRQHYAPKRGQPQNLVQRYEGPGQLPPGWQNEMMPMPPVLERRLRPLPVGYWRGVFEGHAVIYEPDGRISDAGVIF